MINPIICAEGSIGFLRIEELEAAFPADTFERRPLPWEAAFLRGKRKVAAGQDPSMTRVVI